ncbi:mycofactocin-coupled SDR family oxidoreductase [Gordonia sp. FQ]|uniref:mycofactocin-coupled SDR family oxidoreductase n=1 Tax=Gordonia sp. FQ TaxID=3446634 RepID=UPI003F86C429
MGRMDGKVAFITGAARGMGRSHAVRLAREGARIIGVDITEQVETVPYATARPGQLAETVVAVEEAGGEMVAAAADVRDLDALRAAVAAGVDRFGRLDVVVANAGIHTLVPALEMSEDTWQTMIDINLTGSFKTVQAAVPHIIDGGRGGSVILISSLASEIGNANIAHYTAAKAGLVGLMQSLSTEFAPHGIRVNTVHPTLVDTEMIINEPTFRAFRPDLANPTRADFDVAAHTLVKLPMEPPALSPDDVSSTVLYLASEDSRYVTGSKHLVDAGGRF